MSKKTHFAIVLDRSGSMSSTKQATIAGFNDQIEQIQTMSQEDDHIVTVSLVTFANEVTEHLWKADASEIEASSTDGYICMGGTALYDGVGYTLRKLASEMSVEDEDVSYFVCVISDGGENCSSHISADQIKSLVDELEASDVYTLSFLGCGKKGIAAFADKTGFKVENAASWANSNAQEAYVGMNKGTELLRRYGASRCAGASKVDRLVAEHEAQEQFTAGGFDMQVAKGLNSQKMNQVASASCAVFATSAEAVYDGPDDWNATLQKVRGIAANKAGSAS